MTQQTTKKNVSKFDADVAATGSYAYTTEKLSAKLANKRISDAIAAAYDFRGKSVLDLGCGDGTYTLDFPALGIKDILGIDPAEVAIESATKRAAAAGVSDKVSFMVGNIYDLRAAVGDRRFDIIVLRGVLHHLPDAKKAIAAVAPFADAVLVLEPNGYNPVLKLLEKVSTYHIEHEEQSFLPGTIKSWFKDAGMRVEKADYVNLVAMFCPDWLAKTCKAVEPVVEKIPVAREIACGQLLVVAKH